MVEHRRILAMNVKAAREVREVLGVSQEVLADEARIDRTYISGIEQGKLNPSINLLGRLALALKTTPAALLTPRDA